MKKLIKKIKFITWVCQIAVEAIRNNNCIIITVDSKRKGKPILNSLFHNTVAESDVLPIYQTTFVAANRLRKANVKFDSIIGEANALIRNPNYQKH